jgi:hypothetical protein
MPNGPTAASAFSEEMDAAESAIARLPEAWPPFEFDTRRYLLRRFPFSVVYRVESRRILIVAVVHARRRPAYWKSRRPANTPLQPTSGADVTSRGETTENAARG